MNKRLIRLTESDLHRIVKESVNMVLEDAKMINMFPSNANFIIYLKKAFDCADDINKDRIASAFPNIFGFSAA